MAETTAKRSLTTTALLAAFFLFGTATCLFDAGSSGSRTDDGGDVETGDTSPASTDGSSRDGTGDCTGETCRCDQKTRYYADCDDDGFAPDDAATIERCEPPSRGPSSCGGSWTTRTPSGSDDTDCDDESAKARPNFGHDDEKWRCDERDNDCDGTRDEACCKDSVPEPTLLGTAGTETSLPAIAAASPGASSEVEFVAAWAEGTSLRIVQLNRAGLQINSEATTPIGSKITGLDIASHPGGYSVAVSHEGSTGDALKLYRYRPNLDGAQPASTILDGTAAGKKLGAPELEIREMSGWVAYYFQNSSGFTVRSAAVSLADGTVDGTPTTVSKSAANTPTNPAVETVEDARIIAWWDDDADLVRGARVELGSVRNRFEIPVGTSYSVPTETVDVVELRDRAGILYPDFGSNGAALHLASVDPTASGEIQGGPPLTGASTFHRNPVATTLDVDADDGVDRLLAVWMKGMTMDPSIVTATLYLETGGMLSPKTLRKEGDLASRADLAISEGRTGVSWWRRNGKRIEYAPLSIDGVPICSPAP